jgi:hypothetical protein
MTQTAPLFDKQRVGPLALTDGALMGPLLPKKKSDRPEAGRDLTMAIRFPTKLRGAIIKWAENQQDAPEIPEAVRRLVEMGLASKHPAPKSPSSKQKSRSNQRTRASEMAGTAIDAMIDKSATTEDKVYRKRRLIKGPDEFQTLRANRQERDK